MRSSAGLQAEISRTCASATLGMRVGSSVKTWKAVSVRSHCTETGMPPVFHTLNVLVLVAPRMMLPRSIV